jgi:hypothetical protein
MGLFCRKETERMRPIVIPLVVCLCVPFLTIRAAEESQAEEEAKQAAEEKAAEEKLGERLQVNFSGKVILTPQEKENPDVVGVFQSSGRTFLLKLENPSLLNTLKAHNGKEVSLVGRPRNQGKYFLAWGIDQPGAPRVFTRTRGSL